MDGHVEQLAKWSCGMVRDNIKMRDDLGKWMASYNGFYGFTLIIPLALCMPCCQTKLPGILIAQKMELVRWC